MIKSQILSVMGDLLLLNNMEVECKDFPELNEKSYAYGYKAYAVAYSTDYDCVVVRPWSGADYSWPLDVTRITKARLQELCERVKKSCTVVFPDEEFGTYFANL